MEFFLHSIHDVLSFFVNLDGFRLAPPGVDKP